MLCAVLLASVALAAPAAAGPRSAVERVLVHATVAPEHSDEDREHLDAAVIAGLDARDLTAIRSTPRDDARACGTQLCRERTAAAHPDTRAASHWVRAELDHSDDVTHVRISAGRTSDGEVLVEREADCHACDVDDVATVLGARTKEIADELARVPAAAPPPPSLMPQTQHDQTPGRDRNKKMRNAGIGMIVAGSVAAISGAVLIGVDNTHRRRCEDQAPGTGSDCPGMTSTLGGGIALVTGGVVGLAGGITLATIARRKHVTVLSAKISPRRIALVGRF